MALKSTYSSEEKGAEIEEALDVLDKLIDRVKVLYEQYFMGIQKQAPSHLHTESERRLRELTQMHIRNTALRYRLVNLQQKFGSYNTYWKRTLREIESGRYVRNLIKVRQKALASGEEIPEEILAKMPKRMREQIARDRELAVAKAVRDGSLKEAPPTAELDGDVATQPDVMRFAAPPDPRAVRDPRGGHRIDDLFADDGDIASMLSALTEDALASVASPAPARPSAGAGARPAPPPARGTSPIPPIMPPTQTSTRIAPPPASGVRPTPAPPSGVRPTPAAPPGARPTPAPPSGARPTPAPPSGVRPAAAPAAPSPIPGMTEADTRSLYAKYVKAREVVGDKTDPMSYDRLVRTLSSQAPKILEAHKAEGVEFKVVIKDNKVVLKARPK